MRRVLIGLALGLATVALSVPAQAGDCKGCTKVAKKGEGFCCGKGKIFGVELTSQKLYDALAGSKVDASKTKCAGCKEAIKTNGECKRCNLRVADGKAYASQIAYALAKGKPVSTEKAAGCKDCSIALKANGRCTGCNVGFVAGRHFKDSSAYGTALAAYKRLVAAVKTAAHCETCAVAMIQDGQCDKCKVQYKDGKASKG